MSVDREQLLELDKKRLKLEQEIVSITEYLNSEGMPGVEGSLIDSEGFPIQGVDIMAVRTARNKLIILQNDLKSLMNLIEVNMSAFFNQQKENKSVLQPIRENKEDQNLISVGVEESTSSIKNTIKIPMAYVASVADNSPAQEAGLQEGDAIIKFDKTLVYSTSNNPLQKIAEIVGRKVNTEIEVEVLRSETEYIKIFLTPHQWQGQGLLGYILKFI